jgi:hypothetical protein
MQGLSIYIYRTVAGLAGIVASQPLMGYPSAAQEVEIRAFPLAIICEFSEIAHVFYLSKLQKNGVAVYVRPDGVVGMISLTGAASVVGGEGERGSCGGKTIEELRSAGQTVEFNNK